ncbi:zeta toxin family protein [Granulicella arctica]
MVAGANGAGKSTLTRLGREAFQDCVVLDPDAIARSMQRLDVESGSPIDAGRSVLARADGLLGAGQSFLIETTLSGNTYLKMMVRAKSLGYLVVLLYVGTNDVSINLERVQARVKMGGHDVPKEDQLRRYPRSLANLRKAFGLADEAVVYDNSGPKGHVEVAVKGPLGLRIVQPVPEWAGFLRS